MNYLFILLKFVCHSFLHSKRIEGEAEEDEERDREREDEDETG
jgi:hypothetical protein